MDYIKKCEDCSKEFTSQRSDTRFCSDSCRKRTERSLNKSDSVRDVRVKEREAVRDITALEAVERVMRGEPSGIDIGYGKDDYTREMVEERIKGYAGQEDKFTPNWYKIDPPFKSKNHFKKVVWKNI